MKDVLSMSTEQLDALGNIGLVVFDIDNTLVFADDPSFYDQYGAAVERAIARHYNVGLDDAAEIAGAYRGAYGGGEQALFRDDVHTLFPLVTPQPPDTALLYDELCTINPAGRFPKQTALRAGVADLRTLGIKVVALTSSPEPLSRKILAEAGFDPDNDFDSYITYGRNELPPKMNARRQIFQEIASLFDMPHHSVLAVGDSLQHDVMPAQKLGMATCLIFGERPENFEGIVTASTIDIIAALYAAAQAKRLGLPIAGDEVRWRP